MHDNTLYRSFFCTTFFAYGTAPFVYVEQGSQQSTSEYPN